MPVNHAAIMNRSFDDRSKLTEQQQATECHRLRGEAARLRRVAEGLNSKADRDIIVRLAEEAEQAAYAAERVRPLRGVSPRADASGQADI